MCFYSIIFSVPFENIIISFSSPEKAFYYEVIGKQVLKTIEGEDSALIIGRNRNENTFHLYKRTETGWKMSFSPLERVRFGFLDDCQLSICQLMNSKEKYIIISDFFITESTKGISISDSQESNFEKFTMEDGMIKEECYYAVIDATDENYELTVNGESIKIRN